MRRAVFDLSMRRGEDDLNSLARMRSRAEAGGVGRKWGSKGDRSSGPKGQGGGAGVGLRLAQRRLSRWHRMGQGAADGHRRR